MIEQCHTVAGLREVRGNAAADALGGASDQDGAPSRRVAHWYACALVHA